MQEIHRVSHDGVDKNIEISQKSFNKSVFSNVSDFTSPVKRAPKPIKETALMNEMFGAGTDPLALAQDFSKLASNGTDLMNACFKKPAYAQIRCPPVIDTFCRTLASPVASQYNSLSASSRVALFYSTATKYLYFDSETKGISYLKIKENKTKLTANEELLQDVATEEEEIQYKLYPEEVHMLRNKVIAKQNCFKRYHNYVKTEISRDICAPIRQYWITNILDLIPANYKDLDQETMEKIIDDI